MLLGVPSPKFQTAPPVMATESVRVKQTGEHPECGDPTSTSGNAFTVIIAVAVLIHPFASVPVTV
jgi:hypothetical protein